MTAPTDADGRAVLDRLAADRDIRDLALRYCQAWLERDPAMLRRLWAPRADPAPHPDLDAHWVERLLPRWDQLGTTLLHVTNHLVDIDGYRARGRVYCLAQLDRGDTFVEQSIVYEDVYVRHEDRWLFDVRRHLLWFGQERAPHPLEQPAADWPRSQIGAGTLPADLTPFP